MEDKQRRILIERTDNWIYHRYILHLYVYFDIKDWDYYASTEKQARCLAADILARKHKQDVKKYEQSKRWVIDEKNRKIIATINGGEHVK